METNENQIPADKLSYTQAIEELDRILANMQSNNCDIDRLTSMTRRATVLLKECRKRLTATDEELRSILSELEK
ncbi:MAG: exodeoxyribonuclease VII small subunit [Bacteroides sp.]|nr:exodeoxyribonuclease VII small subunit [Bacteroides sp.]MCM1413639.1 exodeoxyribonuclease VII small subunit [Bacteroides sp.]MCM1471144.1 exodeoxyribonuclease VII small subunit [Bacteroides sp.]